MLLAQQDARPLIEFTLAPLFEDHGFPVAAMGVFVVFVALLLVVVFINFLPRMMARLSAPELERPALQIADPDELSEETLVVIAAAVADAVSQPHRVVHIRGLTAEDLGWSLERRMQHHRSHTIQHRDHR